MWGSLKVSVLRVEDFVYIKEFGLGALAKLRTLFIYLLLLLVFALFLWVRWFILDIF